MKTKQKRSKKSGKRTRLISIKTLQKQCESAWKELIAERDGKVCLVETYYPLLEIRHTKVYQADHCITRMNKLLFLEPDNGTMICSSCNKAKGFNNKSITRAVDNIVRARVGDLRFEEMVAIDMKRSANPNWNKRDWLEQQLERLKNGIQEIKRSREVRDDNGISTGQQLFNNYDDASNS